MDRIRFTYNPYFQTAQFYYVSSSGDISKISDSADDKLERFKKDLVLQNQITEILDELVGIYGKETQLLFCGTEDDFRHLDHSVTKYNEQKKTSLHAIKDKSLEIPSPETINIRISNMVADLKRKGFDVNPEQRARLEEILNPEIPVIVTGNYSSGKSMFINALVGAAILPSKQERTTASICTVKQANCFKVSFLSDCNKKFVFDCDNPKKSQIPSDSAFFRSLLHIIDSIEDKYSRISTLIGAINDNIQSLPVKNQTLNIQIPLVNSMIDKNIVFIDIPGNDSDQHQDDIRIINTALENQIKGFIIYVAKPDCLDSTFAKQYINEIVEKTKGKLDINNTLVICNKCESEADIPASAALAAWKANRLIFVSALMGLGCKLSNIDALEKRKKIFKDNKECLGNPNDEDYLSLPKFSILPSDRKNEILNQQIAAENNQRLNPNNESLKLELIAHNSGIRAVEYELSYLSKYLFPINQCKRAQETLEIILRELKGNLDSQYVEKDKAHTKQLESFSEIYKDYVEKIKGIGEKKEEMIDKEFPAALYSIYNGYDQEKDFFRRAYDIIQGKSVTCERDSPYLKETEAEERAIRLNDELNSDLHKLDKEVSDFSAKWGIELCNQYQNECLAVTEKQNFSEEEQKIFRDFFSVDFSMEIQKSFNTSELPIDPIVLVDSLKNFFRKLINIPKRKLQQYSYANNVAGQYKSLYDDTFNECRNSSREKMKNIFARIHSSFDDVPNNNGLCRLYPKLNMAKEKLDAIEAEITRIKASQADIRGKLEEVNSVDIAIHS